MADTFTNTTDDSFVDTVTDSFSDALGLSLVGTPVITPISGKYAASQLITIICDTVGASIYYTLDGSSPDAGSFLYSAPFEMGLNGATVNAIGIKSGYTDSLVSMKEYTLADPADYLSHPERWKGLFNLGAWDFLKSKAKIVYNVGDKMVDITDPRWDIEADTGVPITDNHRPCGYWFDEPGAYPPIVPIPPTNGTIYWSGTNGYYKIMHDGSAYDHTGFEFEILEGTEDWEITDFFTRDHHFAVKKLDGTIWARGKNDAGELGIGNTTTRPPWTQVMGGFDRIIPTSNNYSIAQDSDGKIYLTGDNPQYDMLNIGQTGDTNIYLPDEDDLRWTHITGYGHIMGVSPGSTFPITGFSPLTPSAISTTLAGKGSNTYGTLGFAESWYIYYWHSLSLVGDTVVGLGAGNYTTMIAIGTSGNFELWASGLNTDGQLGLGFAGGTPNPVKVFTKVLGGPWAFFDCGNRNAAAIKADGSLWACGLNTSGELGQGDFTLRHTMTRVGTRSDFVKVSVGPGFMAALTSNGEIWTCGNNSEFELARTTTVVPANELGREALNMTWIDVDTNSSGILALRGN